MHLIKNMSYLMCFYVYKIRDCMDQESQESDLGMCKNDFKVRKLSGN